MYLGKSKERRTITVAACGLVVDLGHNALKVRKA